MTSEVSICEVKFKCYTIFVYYKSNLLNIQIFDLFLSVQVKST